MYIVYERKDIEQLRSKYLLLEVDTIKINEENIVTGYCVIDIDHINVSEISKIGDLIKKHEGLLASYKSQNWDYCIDIIPELTGSFKNELDSFYDVLLDRILKLQEQKQDPNWSAVIDVSYSSEIA